MCVVAEYLTLPLICSYTTLRFRILLHITAFSDGDIPGTFNSAGHGGGFSDDLNAKLLRVFDDLLQWLQSCKTVCFTRSLLVHTDLVHTDLAKPNSPTFPVKHTTIPWQTPHHISLPKAHGDLQRRHNISRHADFKFFTNDFVLGFLTFLTPAHILHVYCFKPV